MTDQTLPIRHVRKPLLRRLALVLTVFIVLHLAGLTLSLMLLQEVRQQEHFFPRAVRVQQELNVFDRELERLNTNFSKLYVAAYTENRIQAQATISHLVDKSHTLKPLLADMGVTEYRLDNLVYSLAETATRLVASNFNDAAVNSMAIAVVGDMKHVTDERQRLDAQFNAALMRLTDESAQTINWLVRLLISLACLMVVVVLGLLGYLYRWFIKPVGRILNSLDRIRAGDFSEPAYRFGSNELGSLARMIDEFRLELKARVKLEHRSQELAGELKERAKLLEKKLKELKLINQVTIDRELKMVELKKELRRLQWGQE